MPDENEQVTLEFDQEQVEALQKWSEELREKFAALPPLEYDEQASSEND